MGATLNLSGEVGASVQNVATALLGEYLAVQIHKTAC